MHVCVILPAAGSSRRFAPVGAAAPTDEIVRSKLDEDLGGRPVLQRTVELFTGRAEVSAIVVAGPEDEAAMAHFRERHADKLGLLGVRICAGGKDHRYETVRNALRQVPDSCTHIAVHDAARPCTPDELIDRVFSAADRFDAVIPGLDVNDTLKRVGSARVAATERDGIDAILGLDPSARSSARVVESTVPRDNLVGVQTPQVFRADVLRRAYDQADLTSTDDAQLVERLGVKVHVVEGDARNLKITRPIDLVLVRAILGVRPPAERAVHKKF
ncbi:MAG: 2-C-methyl-D-erythritol 4-phosphate cytidylyltransferase [Phycisphaerae bacterium]|nr:2-C-methyl-D-erythritol 4-phosphate cytidylyltransferase [Phycisphaerae bacterium]